MHIKIELGNLDDGWLIMRNEMIFRYEMKVHNKSRGECALSHSWRLSALCCGGVKWVESTTADQKNYLRFFGEDFPFWSTTANDVEKHNIKASFKSKSLLIIHQSLVRHSSCRRLRLFFWWEWDNAIRHCNEPHALIIIKSMKQLFLWHAFINPLYIYLPLYVLGRSVRTRQRERER